MLDVVVIGGGLCGLALAHSFHARKFNWALFEARERFGGRLLTHTDAATGACIDLGATWYWPDTQPRITRLVADLGLATVAQHDDDTVLSFDSASEPPQLMRTERLHGGGMRLAGGTQALVNALLGLLPPQRLHTGHALQGVVLQGDHVELHLSVGGHAQVVLARRVVLAVPPRVLLEQVRFTPALEAPVHEAMQASPTWMAVAAKAGMAYERAFWRDAGLSGNALVSHAQATLAEVFDACGPAGQPAALAGFYALDPAQRQLFRQSLELLTRSQFAQLFGLGADDGALVAHDWALDRETCSQLDLQDPATQHPAYGDPQLTQALWGGRLWLAGSETAAAAGGYMEGALAAAGRVRQSLIDAAAREAEASPPARPARPVGVPVAAADAPPPMANALSLEQFSAWVLGERSTALQRYKQRLHRALSQQRLEQLTQRTVLEAAESLYDDALAQLRGLPLQPTGQPADRGRAPLTPGVLEPFKGFADELLAEAVQFNRTSCALSNFPGEAKPAWDYVQTIRRDLAAVWQSFALAANDLLLAREQPAAG